MSQTNIGPPPGALCPLSSGALAFLVKAGMIYCEKRCFQEARDVFSGIRALDPVNPISEIGLGATCFSEARFAEAADHYRQALRLNPRSAYAYALLGESQIFQNDCAAARISLRRAHEIDPKSSYGRLAQSLIQFLAVLTSDT